MTCIIALKKDDTIYWGADSCVSGYETRTMSRPKIFQIGDLVLGGSGTLRMLQVMEYHLVPKKHKKKMSDMEYLIRKIVPQIRKITKEHGQLADKQADGKGEQSGAYFLMGYRNNIYELGFDFSVTSPVENYDAIGSGQSYALGALFQPYVLGYENPIEPLLAVKTALEAAEFFATGVRSPFVLYKQTGNKLEEI